MIVPQKRTRPHRAGTPLELLYDLTFATSFGLAASEVASVVADGHFVAGLVGFGFASFAICWAWINFSWFSSAYDTDDWVFRLATMVQMIRQPRIVAEATGRATAFFRASNRSRALRITGQFD